MSVKYRIRAPDGATYDVEAPDGTTEAQALARVRQQVATPQPDQNREPAPSPDVREPQYATEAETAVDAARSVPGGLARGAMQVVDMASPAGMVNLAGQGFSAITGQSVPQLPMPSQFVEQAVGGYYKPQTTAGKYAETIASFAPAAAIPGSALQRIGRNVVLPGLASEGAGQATEGTPYEPYARAGAALVTGGITSIARPLATIASRVVNRGREAIGLGEANPTRTAERLLREAAAAGRGGAAGVQQSIGEHGAAGITPALIDVTGGQTRRLVRAAAGGMEGDAQDIATDYASRIRSNLPYRGEIQAQRLTPGDTRSAAQATAEMKAARRAAAETDYAEPYQTPVVVDETTLSALQGTHGKNAIRRALSAAEARRDTAQADELRALLSDNPPTQVSAGTLHRVQIAMRERTKAATRAGAYDISGGLEGRTTDLRTTLGQVPELGPANAAFRGASTDIDAITLGTQGPRLPSSQYVPELQRLSGQSLTAPIAARTGYRSAIVDTMRGQRSGQISAMEELATSPEQTTNLTATFGNSARTFQNNLRLEIQRARRAGGLPSESGSQTALRSADAGMLDALQSARGGIIGMAIDALRRTATLTPAMRAEIVRLGTSEADLRRLAASIPQHVSTPRALAAMVVQSQANAPPRYELAR